jgi:hypothetical protein
VIGLCASKADAFFAELFRREKAVVHTFFARFTGPAPGAWLQTVNDFRPYTLE